jgi:hypothetical protein
MLSQLGHAARTATMHTSGQSLPDAADHGRGDWTPKFASLM